MESAAMASHWPAPGAFPAMENGEVHVWQAHLDLAAPRVAALERLLDADERARAARFRAVEPRARYIASRGLLRALLARYLGTEPHRLAFHCGRHGKPALAAESGASALRFNVSHSDGLALYAVTCGCEIGVDLERVRAEVAVMSIATRFFSQREVAALRALPPPLQTGAFFRGWTRKEAYIKARGSGLAMALDSFDVALAPDQPAALLATRDDPGEVDRWSLHDLTPAPDYAAALAVEGACRRVRCLRWNPFEVP